MNGKYYSYPFRGTIILPEQDFSAGETDLIEERAESCAKPHKLKLRTFSGIIYPTQLDQYIKLHSRNAK